MGFCYGQLNLLISLLQCVLKLPGLPSQRFILHWGGIWVIRGRPPRHPGYRVEVGQDQCPLWGRTIAGLALYDDHATIKNLRSRSKYY